ncbi:hypothetical protein ACWEPN_48970, partial [Nonomuraea wenchangensis]
DPAYPLPNTLEKRIIVKYLLLGYTPAAAWDAAALSSTAALLGAARLALTTDDGGPGLTTGDGGPGPERPIRKDR